MNITENAFEPLHAHIPHVVLYTKNNCHICTVVKTRLKSRGIPFITVNMETYNGGEKILNDIKSRIGAASAPVAVVHNVFTGPTGNDVTVFWAGFAPDQVKTLVNTWSDAKYAPYAERIEGPSHDDPANWANKAAELIPVNPDDQATKNRPIYKLTSDGDMEPIPVV